MGLMEEEKPISELQTVGTSKVVVLQANPNRQMFFIKNSDHGSVSAKITVAMGSEVADDVGMPLDVGEHTADSNDAGYSCYKGVITAISNIAGGTLSVTER